LGGVEVVLEALEPALEPLHRRLVEEGGAEHEADAQREQDGRERHDVEPEVDHQPVKSERQKARRTSRTGSDSISATARVNAAARIIHMRSVVRTEVRYRRLTPFASTRASPTFIRTRNVDAIPARPLSRNSTMLLWVPTATISAAPFSCASSM